MNFNERLQKIKDECTRREALKEKSLSELDTLQKASDKIQVDIEIREKSGIIVSDISIAAKKNAAKFLEDVVTDALRYITNRDCRFSIELDDSGKTVKCKFFVTEMINGELSKQDPIDASAGGYIDIISMALRYAYVNLYNKPKLMGWIILDEPGKMVSRDMSDRFGEFIKQLGQDFDRQTIMITHNSNLANIGDNNISIDRKEITDNVENKD